MGRSSWLSDPVSGVVRLAGCARLHLVSARHSYHVHLARLCTGFAQQLHGVCLCTTDSEQGFVYAYVGLARMQLLCARVFTRRLAPVCLPAPVYAAQL